MKGAQIKMENAYLGWLVFIVSLMVGLMIFLLVKFDLVIDADVEEGKENE